MTPRTASRRAWSLLALTLGAMVVALVFDPAAGGTLGELAFGVTLTVAMGGVGAVLAARVRDNPIGWILLALMLFWMLSSAAGSILYQTGDPGLTQVADWQGSWTWMPPILVPVTVVLLLFPDGRLPSRRWRPVLWCAIVGIAAGTVAMAFGPHLGGDPSYGVNPYHRGGISTIAGAISTLMIPAVLGSIASLVVRFRRSRGPERQQLKWLAYGGAVAVSMLLATSALGAIDALNLEVANAVVLLAVTLIPISIAVAILRHRLYDIDRLISRTVTYGLTTVALAVGYAAVVLGLPAMLPVTLDSPLTIATATLAAAAAFRPLARRFQSGIDRRFYRHRYDTQRTIDDFGRRLRSQLDLDALGEELSAVASRTMSPRHVAVWLAPPPEPR